MKNKTYIKKYIGLVEGNFNNEEGIIDVPIKRKNGSIIEREVGLDGDYAITKYKVLENYDNNTSLVEFVLETGRTHQIRVHSKYINHPLVGDTLYGNKSSKYMGQALIAYKIEFIHPITRKNMEIFSNINIDSLSK